MHFFSVSSKPFVIIHPYQGMDLALNLVNKMRQCHTEGQSLCEYGWLCCSLVSRLIPYFSYDSLTLKFILEWVQFPDFIALLLK